MEGGDPDAPTQKRPRLDSATPSTYNGLPLPPHPPHSHSQSLQSSAQLRHHSIHQKPSPPLTPGRPPYPPHSLPPPAHQYPPQSHPQPPPPPQGLPQGPGPYQSHLAHQPQPQHQSQPPPQPHQPSPSLPPSDIRTYSDPRNIPSPSQRTHGVPPPSVTLPSRHHQPTAISQDHINDYPRQTVTPRPSAPDIPSPRSASVDSKHPGMDHGSHQAQWPTPDHRSNGSFSNGYPAPVVSPPQHHDQQYATPPLPPGPGPHYGTPVNSYPPTPYMGGPAQYANSQQAQLRRKQVRATQACNHCRSRKQKCDEARPCQFCRENNYDCQYKDVPPPKQDRSMMQLQDTVNGIQNSQNDIANTLKEFIEGFNSWKHHVDGRLSMFKPEETLSHTSNQPSPDMRYPSRVSISESHGTRMPTPTQGRSQMHRVNSMKTDSPIVSHSNMSPVAAHASTPIKQEAVLAPPQPPDTPASSVRTEHTNIAHSIVNGNSSAKEVLEKHGLQSDHRTAAHQLLQEWTTMHSFTQNVDQINRLKAAGYRVTDYPMHLEQARGLVRVWGVGEGRDLNDGAQTPGSPDSTETESPSPAAGKEGLWGPNDCSSPSTFASDNAHQVPLNDSYGPVGGLDYDGNLKLDSSTCWRLHDSYNKHIRTLHPFLNPHKLRKALREFTNMYSPDKKASRVNSPDANVHAHAGVKRKRSENRFLDPYSPGRDSSGAIEKSTRNAIVLLVLALGKVCEYKDPLPAPQADRDPIAVACGSREPPQRSLGADGLETRPRNIDILPGMAYFSYATDILGNQQGGNDVAHAQAMLLAALYLSQYARVLESWSWINNACRVCLVLIKRDMEKINRKDLLADNEVPNIPDAEHYRLNLIKCVYWTCLQLETDILAEMSSLPASEISKYQDEVAYPSGVYERVTLDSNSAYNESSDSDIFMFIYSSQIHLRVILNQAHNNLYSNKTGAKHQKTNGPTGHDLKDIASTATLHADILTTWRNLLPPALIWDDNEPPSTDLNVARLRAKYYGGMYMILRPYLHIAVHDIELPPNPPTSSSTWSSQTSSPAAMADSVTTPTYRHRSRGGIVDLSQDQNQVLEVALACINSAIQSTIAFDRVGADPSTPYNRCIDTPRERLILTNIFGTLHAQFGNMLVLAAVYSKTSLRSHLPQDTLTRETLRNLFRRTIKMLRQVSPNSPVLEVDAVILEHIHKDILRLEGPYASECPR